MDKEKIRWRDLLKTYLGLFSHPRPPEWKQPKKGKDGWDVAADYYVNTLLTDLSSDFKGKTAQEIYDELCRCESDSNRPPDLETPP